MEAAEEVLVQLEAVESKLINPWMMEVQEFDRRMTVSLDS